MTQAQLGRAIGVSFQQVQKYETGIDRIAAGTLRTIGAMLDVHPGEFFGETSAPSGNMTDLREAMSIAVTMQNITDRIVRKRFSALVEALAGQDTAEHDVASGSV